MDWSKGYTSSFYLTVIDPATWRDTTTINIRGGRITRSLTSLMESADIECLAYPDGIERWVRVYMDIRQTGSSAHVALFTGLATSPARTVNGIVTTHKVECYSVLKPAADILLPRGWYALAGQNGAALVASLLGVGPAPVVIDGAAPALSDTILAEDGETNLTMAHKILLAMGWRLRISGDGTITICPMATESSAKFGETSGDCLELRLDIREDRFPCPNIFRAVIGGQSAVVADEDPDSDLSIVQRGREVWAEELSPVLATNESLESYAARRLKSLQSVALTASYSRRYWDGVGVGDIVEISYPKQGLDGAYMVTSQSVTLGHNATTSEEVVKI